MSATRRRATRSSERGRLLPTETVLGILQIVIAATAVGGGATLVLGSLLSFESEAIPPTSYLAGSPFTSYLVPGLVLALVVGGIHLAAFLLLVQRNPWRLLAAAIAGYALVIWIAVQMTIIPFSMLQVAYLAAGLAELGLVLLRLGILRPAAAVIADDAASNEDRRLTA